MEDLQKGLSSIEKSMLNAKEKMFTAKEDEAYAKKKVENDAKEIISKREKNAPMNSQTAGAGKELVPDVLTLESVVERAIGSERYAFLNGLSAGRLPGVLSQTNDLPIMGTNPSAGVYGESTSGTYGPLQSGDILPTDKVSFTTRKLGTQIELTRELQLFSVVDVLARAEQKVIDVVFNGIADAVLNGDTSALGTGNINSDDQAAATTYPAKADGSVPSLRSFDDGLRKQPLNGNAGTDRFDVAGPVTINDILKAAGRTRLDVLPSDRIVILDNESYHTLMQDQGFKDMSANGVGSTISQGAITNIAGMDFFVTNFMRRTEDDGKLSGATPTNNTKGQVVIAERNVIQHGFSSDVVTAVQDHDIIRGVFLQAYTFFGFANINKKAGVIEPSVVVLHNIDNS